MKLLMILLLFTISINSIASPKPYLCPKEKSYKRVKWSKPYAFRKHKHKHFKH